MLILSPVRKVFHLEKRWWGHVYLVFFIRNPASMERVLTSTTISSSPLRSSWQTTCSSCVWRIRPRRGPSEVCEQMPNSGSTELKSAAITVHLAAILHLATRNKQGRSHINIHRITASLTDISFPKCSVRETLLTYFIIFYGLVRVWCTSMIK